MDILLLVAITFLAGIVGGLVMAEAFDLEQPHEKRRRQRREKRQARREKNRRNVNFTIDKF
jgi:Flp pilus assembly protein TadB